MGNERFQRLLCLVAAVFVAWPAAAQESTPASRTAIIEAEQAIKASELKPYSPLPGEALAQKAQDILAGGGSSWHPFFESAYSGGGFTLGVGHSQFLSSYSWVDVRGSYTISGYKRVEAEFVAPRLFDRRGELSLLAGWREATQVGFYGYGANTSEDARTNYGFQRPYASALLEVRPTRGALTVSGGLEWTSWKEQPGEGSFPSVETQYTPATLSGLGASVDYIHTQATVGLDTRTSRGYSRRGTFLGVTGHDFSDRDDLFGFQRVDYEGIQHIPLLREAWVISLHGVVSHAVSKDGQDIPFFMLPSLGGGSNLRGFGSWRFRDRASLLLQAEWRIMVNRYLDTAFFYDTGTVAPEISDLDFGEMKRDFGFGVRFHGPTATPLRVDVAKSHEGLRLVFASSAVF